MVRGLDDMGLPIGWKPPQGPLEIPSLTVCPLRNYIQNSYVLDLVPTRHHFYGEMGDEAQIGIFHFQRAPKPIH